VFDRMTKNALETIRRAVEDSRLASYANVETDVLLVAPIENQCVTAKV
jgi:hypothetical protein